MSHLAAVLKRWARLLDICSEKTAHKASQTIQTPSSFLILAHHLFHLIILYHYITAQ
jgi:hypothetical protein